MCNKTEQTTSLLAPTVFAIVGCLISKKIAMVGNILGLPFRTLPKYQCDLLAR